MNRRGFLQGCMVGAATVAITLRMATAGPSTVRGRYTWAEANEQYDYAIDKSSPWDVLVYDKNTERYITPDELTQRGKMHWFGKPTPPAPWNENDIGGVRNADPDLLHARQIAAINGANTYDDPIDRAFGAVGAIAISQGFIGFQMAGKPGFDGPWKELEDEIDEPRIITTSREFYEELAS